MIKKYKNSRHRRKVAVRAKISGRSTLPRLSVFRSNKYIYAQLIDDSHSTTRAQIRGKDARTVGLQVAKKSLAAGVTAAVFDRGPYKYHGRVKAVAEAAREAGLKL